MTAEAVVMASNESREELAQRLLEWEQRARDAEDRAERLQQEAQFHAQEARTQRTTVQQIYQMVTGSTGEPGDWNGADPVRQLVEEHDVLAAHVERLAALLQELEDAMPVTPHIPMAKIKGEYLERVDAALQESPTTSLARRDSEKQAEALEEVDRYISVRQASARIVVRSMARKLRRQTKGDQS